MNRIEKIVKVNALKKLINDKEKQIAEEEKQLKDLKQMLQQEKKSVIPILLFSIDRTLPMPDDERDYEYEYVYYYPDLDETDIKTATWYSKNSFLDNVIDMREFFKKVGIPSRIWPEGIYQYDKQLSFAVSQLKTIIDDLFASHSINSWNDLALLLNEVSKYYDLPKYNEEGKDKSRLLKQ